jgi:sugar (pentulose or hexulose) kinase
MTGARPIDVEDLRTAEGGAQSPFWCTIVAEALGRLVTLAAKRDTSAAGAALIGRAALEGAFLREIADRSCVLSERGNPSYNRDSTVLALDVYRPRTARLLT